MKCYNHHDRDAFGICRACGKALCLECMETVNNQICCKDNQKCKETLNLSSYAFDLIKKQGFSKKRKLLVMTAGISSVFGGGLCLTIPDPIMKSLGIMLIFLGALFLTQASVMGKKLSKGK